MIVYLIRYQTRRREAVSIPQGDWQDKEVRVVAGEDAREALNELVGTIENIDFRLRGIEVCGRVDMIAHGLE